MPPAAMTLIPRKQNPPEGITRGQNLQQQLMVMVVQGAITVPLKAGDRDRMAGPSGAIGAWAATLGKRRGHGYAVR